MQSLLPHACPRGAEASRTVSLLRELLREACDSARGHEFGAKRRPSRLGIRASGACNTLASFPVLRVPWGGEGSRETPQNPSVKLRLG